LPSWFAGNVMFSSEQSLRKNVVFLFLSLSLCHQELQDKRTSTENAIIFEKKGKEEKNNFHNFIQN
jgi:hypothetical protein